MTVNTIPPQTPSAELPTFTGPYSGTSNVRSGPVKLFGKWHPPVVGANPATPP